MSASNKPTVADKAYFRKEIRYLLIPYYMHRAQITTVEQRKGGGTETVTRTFYAMEHSASYSQCLHGHAKSILLGRLAGYLGLIDFIENKLGAKVKKAVLYQREPGTATFNRLLRRYYRTDGILQLEGDVLEPGIDESDVLELQYQVIGGRLIIVPPEHSEQVIQLRESLKK